MANLIRAWRWWRRRGWLTLLVLVGVMVIFRLGWGWWVERQINAKLAEIRGRGEAGEWREVAFPTVKDEENAWPIWVKALNALNPAVDPPKSSPFNFGDPPYPPAWFNVAAASEKANAQALALARMARGRPVAQFRKQLPAPANTWLPYLNTAKMLVNTLADAGEYSHFTGDDDEALERLTDLMHLGESLHQDDFFVSQLVAIGAETMACNSIQVIAPGVAESGPPEGRAAREKRIRQLISVLLDERLAREGMQRSIQVERMMRADAYRGRAEGAWWIRPLGEREILRAIEGFEVLSEAARCANFEDAREVLKRCKLAEVFGYGRATAGGGGKRVVPRYSRWFEETGVDPDSILQREYRVIGQRRLAAMALACQLYHARRGKWPAKLDDLVPEFLGELPKHPFYADGRRIGHVVIKGGEPDGGDLTIFVAADESAKAVDGKPDQADAPGENSKIEKKAEKP